MPTRTTATLTPTRTTPARAQTALSRCIEPVDEESFLAGTWERRPLLVPRDQEGRFDDLLSLDELERLVTSGGLRYPGFRLVKAGEKLETRGYTSDVSWRPVPFTAMADVPRTLAEVERGATLVLQALHHTHPPLTAFCRDLEARLGHPVQANAYFTPRRSQGLPVHHDTHDVLSLQVTGEKRWLVYEPALELPLRQQRYRPDLGEPGEPVLDVVLRPGDTLYLPRGWLHQALTSETDSLHLTIGVNVYSWLDAVRAALDECADDVEFRRSVPADGGLQADLLERLRRRLEPEAVARRARGRLLGSRRPVLDGQWSELRALDELTMETPLEQRATVLAELEGTTLLFEGKRIEFPAHVREELGALLASPGPIRACDLPGSLDGDSRLVLVRRLVREGFLRRSAADA
jgi:JmjC domain